ncbi:hypothetical protein [Legionella israelensis]|uniref:Uncharacterized protein n=1 Tax=Legionella israelensis TaxID=454 RepID=A0A0W0VIY8_9GAMM|nr:hypothetical protein [Legionella israelensis]KTD20043.1 hypothetical protein Lisr_1893 [Legionella israelensis]QBS11221.1 hypothetical protein E4T55_15020 [Legionella israelensis]SCY58005.1 hypothetical protein SAMN02746069_02934 [Legionella israelensis DSM 19235]STX61040.1 Uncharacterised protein [Legionella israelensis]
MKNSIKYELASKIFEMFGLNQRDREEWYMASFLAGIPNMKAKYEYEKNEEDPPDYVIKSNVSDDVISCELTEIHLDENRKGAKSQARIERYHSLLNKLKSDLKKNGLSHLYGVFSLKKTIRIALKVQRY